MLMNKRSAIRYPMNGLAILTFDEMVITGELVDISDNGLAVQIDKRTPLQVGGQIGSCRVESADLAAPVTCLVSPRRIKQAPLGAVLACRFESIEEDQLRLLRAYRALTRARELRRARLGL